MKDTVNRKKFFVLLSLSILSVIAIFPYILTVQGEVLQQIGQPFIVIFIAQLAQSVILFAIAISLGLFFTKKIHFQLPVLEAIIKKTNPRKILKTIFWKSVVWGIVTALIIYLLDPLFTSQGAGISTHQNYAPIWQTLLAAFYGGITEEILMRLFLMTFFVWLGVKLFKQNKPSSKGILISIILAAVIFGLGHLPLTASITNITPLVIARAIVLNGVGGVIFGWLFWRKGLESAMIAHFTADIFLLTLLPLLFR